MRAPTGLLLVAGPLRPEDVRAVLHEQGGPEWDETVFMMLAGVDLAGLMRGEPAVGEGTAVCVASSGWWLRALDDLADRLCEATGSPTLAVFEAEEPAATGWHLAAPGAEPRRGMAFTDEAGGRCAWADGVAALLGLDEGLDRCAPLWDVVGIIHQGDPSGVHLPAMCAFRLGALPSAEWRILTQVRGTGMLAGSLWRPSPDRSPDDAIPESMPVIVIRGAVRLPGPPRLASAGRTQAIAAAKTVIDGDGWVCLVPEVSGVVAIYGTAVRVLQLAPVSNRRYIGVLHPRAAVRVGSISDGVAAVRPVLDEVPAPAEGFGEALDRLVAGLADTEFPVVWDEEELRASADPGRLIAWQIPIDVARSQQYLGSGDPVVRLEVVVAALEQPIVDEFSAEAHRRGAPEPTVADTEGPLARGGFGPPGDEEPTQSD